VNYINRGRERIQFDRKGDEHDLHIVECGHCETEFRTPMDVKKIKCSHCSASTNTKFNHSEFKIIGFIDNHQGSELAC
jgi:protein-arginine kinase activator protein McsA